MTKYDIEILPPLPRAYGYLTGCNLDMESSLEAAQAVCDHDNAAERELQESNPKYADPDWQPATPEPLFTAEQMHEYARNHEAHLMQSYAPLMDAVSAKYRIEKTEAALAAITAAEPVAWSYECRQPHAHPEVWAEFFSRKKPAPDNPEVGRWIRNVAPLYRAAPPQQVVMHHKSNSINITSDLTNIKLDATRWQAFRNRDDFDDLYYDDFKDKFREEADSIIDNAIKGKQS